MLNPAFHLGDHVVTNKRLLDIPSGTGGRVVQVYAFDCYDVYLDGCATPCFVFGADLILMPLTDTDEPAEGPIEPA